MEDRSLRALRAGGVCVHSFDSLFRFELGFEWCLGGDILPAERISFKLCLKTDDLLTPRFYKHSTFYDLCCDIVWQFVFF